MYRQTYISASQFISDACSSQQPARATAASGKLLTGISWVTRSTRRIAGVGALHSRNGRSMTAEDPPVYPEAGPEWNLEVQVHIAALPAAPTRRADTSWKLPEKLLIFSGLSLTSMFVPGVRRQPSTVDRCHSRVKCLFP